MKQKITIEIDNDTGVEFEERGEYRPPREGEYFIADNNAKIERSVGDFERKHYFVLAPKIDQELEEAKKKFPVGSLFLHKNYGGNAFEVQEVYRADYNQRLLIKTQIYPDLYVDYCTPFPVPTWRCCESDKPEKAGHYPTRLKKNHKFYFTAKLIDDRWDMPFAGKGVEWLDEGEL